MARLLVENDWFEPLPPNGLVDTVYEELLLGRASVLFPGFLAVRHRCLLSNDRGNVTPHFALIDRHYRTWWLVLLQTGKPPSAAFFQDVAEIIRAHPYEQDDARTLAQRNASLDETSLARLMRDEMPKLYVLLGHPPPPALTSSDIRIGVAELFRSSTGGEILRINGEHPRQQQERIGICARDPLVQRGLLKLSLRKGATLSTASRWDIEIDGAMTTWTIRQQGDETWLIEPVGVSLPIDVDMFALIRFEDGRLNLVPHTS